MREEGRRAREELDGKLDGEDCHGRAWSRWGLTTKYGLYLAFQDQLGGGWHRADGGEAMGVWWGAGARWRAHRAKAELSAALRASLSTSARSAKWIGGQREECGVAWCSCSSRQPS
jgi:hypothetical protein